VLRETSNSSATFDDALRTGRDAWPAIRVDPDRFRRHIEANRAAAGVGGLHDADLYLAIGCAAGDAASLAAFEQHLGPEVGRSLARLRLHGPAASEIHQRLRHKLFVAEPGAEPRILGYSGRGPLRAWLRALVAHEALSELRRARREDHLHASDSDADSALGDRAAGDDPELAQVRARYATPFREAFQAALTALSPRDRNLVRLVYTDGLTVEQVATTYGVHRVSVSRWLGQIRAALLEDTRSRLRERLHLDDSELRSLTRLCLSQIDVSLDRIL
jgi:RNA polymerase sigma-70 factor (ECF subfamily)